MAKVICQMSDCIHRSKRKSRTWKYASGAPCYGCMLEAVTITNVFDPDGDIEALAGKENTVICMHYEPRASETAQDEEDEEDEGFE